MVGETVVVNGGLSRYVRLALAHIAAYALWPYGPSFVAVASGFKEYVVYLMLVFSSVETLLNGGANGVGYVTGDFKGVAYRTEVIGA